MLWHKKTLHNFQNLFYKGYYAFHEAIKDAPRHLGLDYFVNNTIRPIDRTSSFNFVIIVKL